MKAESHPENVLGTGPVFFALDLGGTFLFAIEGAMAAVAGHLDYFGITVLAFATALGGGIVRDVLIGDVPPASMRDPRYGMAAFSGAFVVILLHAAVTRIPDNIAIALDALALSLFAIAGAAKALEREINRFVAMMLGTVTAVGGGVVRDLMLAQVPSVLRTDIYAVAALIGCAVMVTGIRRGLPARLMMFVGLLVCFLVRLVSVWQDWQLPRLQ